MMSAALLALALFASGPSASPGESPPKDVAVFIDRSETCSHWLGEPPYDKQRDAEIRRNVATYCTDLGKRLALLKKHHARDQAVSALLARFDPASGLSGEFPGD